MDRFFFDTDAMIGILLNSPGLEPYADAEIVTERGHVYELVNYLAKERPARDVLPIVGALREERLEPTNDDLLAAVKLRRQHRRLSAQDALGYVVARRAGLRFVTGDSAFRGLPGVEYIRCGMS